MFPVAGCCCCTCKLVCHRTVSCHTAVAATSSPRHTSWPERLIKIIELFSGHLTAVQTETFHWIYLPLPAVIIIFALSRGEKRKCLCVWRTVMPTPLSTPAPGRHNHQKRHKWPDDSSSMLGKDDWNLSVLVALMWHSQRRQFRHCHTHWTHTLYSSFVCQWSTPAFFLDDSNDVLKIDNFFADVRSLKALGSTVLSANWHSL